MRRMLLSVFLAAALLTGCGGRETPASPDEAPGGRSDGTGRYQYVYRRVGGIPTGLI